VPTARTSLIMSFSDTNKHSDPPVCLELSLADLSLADGIQAVDEDMTAAAVITTCTHLGPTEANFTNYDWLASEGPVRSQTLAFLDGVRDFSEVEERIPELAASTTLLFSTTDRLLMAAAWTTLCMDKWWSDVSSGFYHPYEIDEQGNSVVVSQIYEHECQDHPGMADFRLVFETFTIRINPQNGQCRISQGSSTNSVPMYGLAALHLLADHSQLAATFVNSVLALRRQHLCY